MPGFAGPLSRARSAPGGGPVSGLRLTDRGRRVLDTITGIGAVLVGAALLYGALFLVTVLTGPEVIL